MNDNTNNGTWKLGRALENYMALLQQLGTDGVEDRLAQIREATFERMRKAQNPAYQEWVRQYLIRQENEDLT